MAGRSPREERCGLAGYSWLANRLPELKQVKIETQGETRTIDLVFDEDYQKQFAIPLSQIH